MLRTALTRLLAVLLLTLAAVPAWAGDGSAILKYAPNESKLLLTVNLAGLRTTPSYQTALNGVSRTPKFREAIRNLGNLDLATVDTVVISNTDLNENDPQLLIVLEGRFQRAAIEAEVKKNTKVTQETVNNVPLFVAGDREAAGFAADNIIVLGAKNVVAAAITAGNGGARDAGRFTPGIRAQLQSVDKSQEVWFVATIPARVAARNARASGVKSVRGSLDIANALNSQLQRAVASPEMTAMGLQSVFQQVRVAASGADVSLTMALDGRTWMGLLQTTTAILAEELH